MAFIGYSFFPNYPSLVCNKLGISPTSILNSNQFLLALTQGSQIIFSVSRPLTQGPQVTFMVSRPLTQGPQVTFTVDCLLTQGSLIIFTVDLALNLEKILHLPL